MVPITEIFTDKNTMSAGPYVPVKNPSARKSLCHFLELLDVKINTAVQSLGDVKSFQLAHMCLSKILVQGNHSVIFWE